MRHHFYTCDVFTDRRFGGNQLAVFPEAHDLDPALMQPIAREFNLSETVFIVPPNDPAHAARLRIFTPSVELPFAGHPTIGAAYVLAATGALPLTGERTPIVFEERVGPVPVTIFAREGKPTGAQLTAALPPEFGPTIPDHATLARVLSIDASDMLGTPWEPQGVSCGVPFLFIPLRDRDALARARVDTAVWRTALHGPWASGLFVLCFDPERPDSDVRARMFGPGLGIPEDPATGAAAAALGGYLGARSRDEGTLRWRVEQGFEMGRPSILEVEAERVEGAIVQVRVGGASVLVSEGWMEVGDEEDGAEGD